MGSRDSKWRCSVLVPTTYHDARVQLNSTHDSDCRSCSQVWGVGLLQVRTNYDYSLVLSPRPVWRGPGDTVYNVTLGTHALTPQGHPYGPSSSYAWTNRHLPSCMCGPGPQADGSISVGHQFCITQSTATNSQMRQDLCTSR